jgi:hypothetical protein
MSCCEIQTIESSTLNDQQIGNQRLTVSLR